MKKRIIHMFFCIVMVGIFFAGCGRKENAEDETVTLDVVISQYGNYTKQWWKEFEKNFEEVNEDIDLNIEIVSWNDIYSVVSTRISSNQQPDILNISGFADYVADDLLMPVQEYVSDQVKADILPDFWEANAMEDGEVFALPILASCRVLFCNMDILAEAGIEKVPTTWDEVLTACQAVKDNCDGIVPWGLDISTDEGQAAFSYYTWNFDGGYVDDDNNWALNSDENVEAVNFMKKLYDSGFCNSAPATETRYPLQNSFSAGTLAMMIGPMNMVSADSTVNYETAAIPGKGISLGVCDQLMVFKDEKAGDKRTEAVKRFFDAFYEVETYSDYMVYEGFLPVTTSATENLRKNAEKYIVGGTQEVTGSSEYFSKFCEILSRSKFYPMQKTQWMDVRNGVVDVEQKVCENLVDARTALNELQEAVTR